jgi:hypothetical protein
MRCPHCLSDNLELKQDTHCCEDCGGSFQVIQEPQDILLESRGNDFIGKSEIILEWAKENGYDVVEMAMAEELKDYEKNNTSD